MILVPQATESKNEKGPPHTPVMTAQSSPAYGRLLGDDESVSGLLPQPRSALMSSSLESSFLSGHASRLSNSPTLTQYVRYDSMYAGGMGMQLPPTLPAPSALAGVRKEKTHEFLSPSYVIANRNRKAVQCELTLTGYSIAFTLGDCRYEFAHDDTQEYFRSILPGATLFREGKNGMMVNVERDLPLHQVLVLGNVLALRDQYYYLDVVPTFFANGVDGWLWFQEMERYINLFKRHQMTDFLALLFLTEEALRFMGVHERDIPLLWAEIQSLHALTPTQLTVQWLYTAGFHEAAQVVAENDVDFQSLAKAVLGGSCRHYAEHQPDESLSNFILDYHSFSSVNESYKWAMEEGYQEKAVLFLKYGTPFYGLCTTNALRLFTYNDDPATVMKKLDESPIFHAKSLAFWLRESNLESLSPLFARHKLTSLEAVKRLTARQLREIVTSPSHCLMLEENIKDLKDQEFLHNVGFQLFDLLDTKVYSYLLGQNYTSVSEILLLTPQKLTLMGIASKDIQRTLLRVLKQICDSVPPQDVTDPLCGREYVKIFAHRPVTVSAENSKPKKRRKRRNRKKKLSAAVRPPITPFSQDDSPRGDKMDKLERDIQEGLDLQCHATGRTAPPSRTPPGEEVFRWESEEERSASPGILAEPFYLSEDEESSNEMMELHLEVEAFRKRFASSLSQAEASSPIFCVPD